MMNRRIGLSAAALLLSAAIVQAAPLLSQQQARAKAIDFLKGDPYGRTPAQVADNIKQVRFVPDGNTKACGAKKKPAWEFHVVVTAGEQRIDGYLALDARTGAVLCANLPLLD
jgi:hypothetical protein